MTFVGDIVEVCCASSFDFLDYLPLSGIKGSFTPFFFFASPCVLSLNYLCRGLFLFFTDYTEDYLLIPPYNEDVSNALLDPTDPLDDTFLDRTFDTTLANRLEKVGFSPTYLVEGLSPAKFLVSSSYGSAPVKSLGS